MGLKDRIWTVTAATGGMWDCPVCGRFLLDPDVYCSVTDSPGVYDLPASGWCEYIGEWP